MIEGAGQTWTKGSDKAAEFVVKRSEKDEETFGLFTELMLDGETLLEDVYTKTQGSLIIDLKASYLEKLSEGEHTLTAVFEDGSAETNFSIAEAKAPEDDKTPTPGEGDKGVKTGDSSNPAIWICLMIVSLIAFAVLGIQRRAMKR